ncbi:sigma factor-like helix-turn-helix DNA-binding protein [Nocardioides mesophilus]|uniref:RNA polymerase sigma factor 70 region 4 type 2 domain-containing protein n=1 Tax=Nocardioides mesophilus TaxID=433659 RepID=A0A7G9RFZ9_9ACTN|nr:sigma factor-like helix-turn-helix DNA-binding protein [Nocardioides mesophilus]QNN54524.1 hypothetical protein H9L09_09555 [Nocardioides mesophilus]
MTDDWVAQGGWTTEDAVRLYAAHRLGLVRTASLLVGDQDAAEDLVRDTFAAFLARRHGVHDPDEALDRLRSALVLRSRRAVRDDQRARPDEKPRNLIEAVRRLPARQREVLVLRYWCRLSELQTADALGTSATTTRSRTRRALEALAASGASGTSGGFSAREEGAAADPSLEDRLGSVFAARAEAVALEDLRPFEVPEPARRNRRLVALMAGATAAAAVVAAPFLTGAEDKPPPADPPGAVRMDVDGDGDPDLVSVSFDLAAHTYLLRVAVFDGPTVTHQGLALHAPTILGGADLDDDYSAEVALKVSQSTARLPEFFRYVDGRLTRLDTPAVTERVHGWDSESPGNQFTLQDGRLYTWALQPSAPDGADTVAFWAWRVRGDALLPGPRQQRCLSVEDPMPVECGVIPEEESQETTADLDGDGLPDDVRLSFTAAQIQHSIAGYRVRAALSGGGSVAAEGPAGGRPMLLNPLSLGHDERQQVLVSQAAGDSLSLSLFGLLDHRLVLLLEPKQPELGYGVHDGRVYRWAASPGRLVTFTKAALVSPGVRRVDGFEWRVRAGSLVARPLDDQCLRAGRGYLPEPC